MKKSLARISLNLAFFLALSTQLHAVIFTSAGVNNFWGNNANWDGDFPDGVGTTATIERGTGMMPDRTLLLATSAGVDQSFTVGTFEFGEDNGGGLSNSDYDVSNVSGGTASLIFEASSGNALLRYRNLFAPVTMEVNADIQLNSNLSILVERSNNGTYRINGDISGSNGIIKGSIGTLELNGLGSYTGDTTFSNGTLLLGAADRIADASDFVFNGGTFATGGFSETAGTVLLSDTSAIDLGSGDSDLVLSDSSALSWTGATNLDITNFDEGTDSIRFGTNAFGLTGTQLSQITLNGGAALLNDSGFLISAPNPVPEPSSFALLGGALALGYIVKRRRK